MLSSPASAASAAHDSSACHTTGPARPSGDGGDGRVTYAGSGGDALRSKRVLGTVTSPASVSSATASTTRARHPTIDAAVWSTDAAAVRITAIGTVRVR